MSGSTARSSPSRTSSSAAFRRTPASEISERSDQRFNHALTANPPQRLGGFDAHIFVEILSAAISGSIAWAGQIGQPRKSP